MTLTHTGSDFSFTGTASAQISKTGDGQFSVDDDEGVQRGIGAVDGGETLLQDLDGLQLPAPYSVRYLDDRSHGPRP